ncbi:MAG: hypothetical protein ACTSW4_03090 [Candidatus Ranarchaeia archaeon]
MRNLAIPLGFLLLILEMPTYYGLEWWWAAEYFAFTELSYLVPYFLIMVTIAWLFMMGLGQDGWLYHRFTHLIRKEAFLENKEIVEQELQKKTKDSIVYTLAAGVILEVIIYIINYWGTSILWPGFLLLPSPLFIILGLLLLFFLFKYR